MKKIEKLKKIQFKSEARGPWVSIENREKINEIIEALNVLPIKPKPPKGQVITEGKKPITGGKQ